MENIILDFLNIYFWMFIVCYILSLLYTLTSEYKLNKKNAIKFGNYKPNIFKSIIGWSLFILSIVLT